MLILISGATGFVGRALLPALGSSHEVVCLARDVERVPVGPDSGVAGVVEVDLQTGVGLERLPRRADVIVHLAQGSGTYPEEAAALFGVNANGTARLLDYAARTGVPRFVFTSTGTVYEPARRPLDEGAALAARPAFYALTKRVAEDLVLAYANRTSALVVRLFAPYGPGQRDRLIPRLVEAVKTGAPITLRDGGSPRLNPIWIDDLTSILVKAVGGVGSGVINIAGPDTVGIREIGEIAAAALGVAPLFVNDSTPASGDLVADTRLMHLVFEPPSLVRPTDGVARVARVAMAMVGA